MSMGELQEYLKASITSKEERETTVGREELT
jgi:hypothetical protein